jgi:hypothetical protein
MINKLLPSLTSRGIINNKKLQCLSLVPPIIILLLGLQFMHRKLPRNLFGLIYIIQENLKGYQPILVKPY